MSSLVDSNIVGLEFYRKERTVQLYLKREKRTCVTLSFHPQRSGFYILPAAHCRIDTTEKYRPFAREVWEGTLISVTQMPNDRIVEMTAEIGKTRWLLVFEATGPNGNLWLLDGDRKISSSLRRKTFDPGRIYRPPDLPAKLDPAVVSAEDLRRLFESNPGANPARLLEKTVYGIDYYLARSLLPGEDFDGASYAGRLHDHLKRAVAAYRSADSPIYAYVIKGKSRFYPIRISGYEPLGKFSSLSQAQCEVIAGLKEKLESDTLRDRTIRSLQGRLKKAHRLAERLDADVAEASGYERYLQYADLLKINLTRLRRGMESITVDDLYAEGDSLIIPLDPKLTGPENVESYSRRYRKGREGLALLRRRKENVSDEARVLEEALKRFQEDFEEARNRYPELLPPADQTASPTVLPRLPYKEYQTSTGVTVWVGKTEADNDRLTLEFAKPHELWFHASQCPGSHVVMKFPHKKFVPSRREIEEAAALAAYFSKARKSARVPVSYTLRKYVRKPRQSKAGLVTLGRYETIMVEPRELEKKE